MIIIFDLDGTLLNTIDDLGYACNYALEQTGYPTYPIEAYPAKVGNGINNLIRRALPEEARTEENVLRVRAYFVPYYDVHNCDYTRPYEGIPELLAELKSQGHYLAVASNKYQAATEKIVNHFFPGVFDVVLGERDGVERKPNPQIVFDIVNSIKSKVKSQKLNTLYIGDSLVDYETAKNANVRFVACSWGFVPREKLKNAGITTIIDQPKHILERVEHTGPAGLKKSVLTILLAAFLLLTGCGHQGEQTCEPIYDRSDFVEVTEVIPDVILEIRYYSTYNFVGSRIDGYERPLALMTRQAADSLKAVSDELKAKGYRLKIWDTYRPQRAVNHFIRWAEDIQDTAMKAVFYPMVDKSLLFEQGYIYARSSHSRGSTVDLTLIDARTGKELDMGSPFDWFGVESHPDYRCKLYRQSENRLLLHSAMVRHGFEGIDSEWWHFTLVNEPYPNTYFDFSIN